MSTEVVRKTVSYTIPDAPSAESLVDRSWYKTVIDIMLTNLNELDSFDVHDENMEKRKTDNDIPPTKQLNGITDTETKMALEEARANILRSDSPLYAKDVNTIATSLNKIYSRAKSGSRASTVSKDEVVGRDKLSTFISACIEVSQELDPKAEAVWSDDGLCSTSCEKNCQTHCQSNCQIGCQVSCQSTCQLNCQENCQLNCMLTCQLSCQSTCQLACQSCFSNTCHKTKLGIVA